MRKALIGLALSGLVLIQPGCGGGQPEPSSEAGGSPAASATLPSPPPLPAPRAQKIPADSTAAAPKAVPLPQRESWDVYTMGGARVGYAHTTISHVRRSGRKVVRVESLTHLTVKRFGQTTEQEIHLTGIETLDGKLIEFQAEVQQGKVPMQTTGKVAGNQLQLETTTLGKRTSTSISWSSEYGGFYGTEESLLRRPMQPGERRTVRSLTPVLNQVATIELVAKDYEPVKLLGASFKLLRIDTTTRFSGGVAISGAAWCDRQGETLKTRTDLMQLETVRATKALALEKKDLAEIDLGWDVTVTVDRRLESPHGTKQIRYRVQLDGGDPAEAFVSGPSQRVKSTGPHTAEVTVYAIRPGRPDGNPDAAAQQPTEADRRPNNLIQSDNPKIAAMAQKAAGEEKDPWQTSLKLERYVNKLIEKKNFSQAFATAAEVAQDPEGDCTEHAVLLAALARARGIPARVAVGLVYVEDIQGSGAFGYHMWTEVYVAGRWVPLDAMLGEGGIGAAHLKIAHGNLSGASAYGSFLPVVQVLGRLKIEVLEVE